MNFYENINNESNITQGDKYEFFNNPIWKALKITLNGFIAEFKLRILDHLDNTEKDKTERILMKARIEICNTILNFEQLNKEENVYDDE